MACRKFLPLKTSPYQSAPSAPQLSLRRLRGFLALARRLNFRHAAQDLGISQPALSGQIRALEKGLGLALFSRTTRRVGLTAEGERFIPRARRLLKEHENTIDEMRANTHMEEGEVAFSCIPTIAATVFPRIIQEFTRHNPAVKVEMMDDSTTAMEQRILNRDVDFGVGGAPRSQEELEFSAIVDDLFVLVCRKDHPLARRRKVGIREVLAFPVISLSKESNVRTTLRMCLEEDGLTFSPAYELNHHYPIGAMVEAGLGVTLLPSMACDMIQNMPALQLIPLANRSYSRSVGLIKLRGNALSSAARRFYELIVNTLALRTAYPGNPSRTTSRPRRREVAPRDRR